MPPVRKRAVAPKAATPVSTPAPTGTLYIAATQMDALGLNPTTATQVLADANAVSTQIAATPWVTAVALVAWANQAWGNDPTAITRLNAATALLVKMGLIFQVG